MAFKTIFRHFWVNVAKFGFSVPLKPPKNIFGTWTPQIKILGTPLMEHEKTPIHKVVSWSKKIGRDEAKVACPRKRNERKKGSQSFMKGHSLKKVSWSLMKIHSFVITWAFVVFTNKFAVKLLREGHLMARRYVHKKTPCSYRRSSFDMRISRPSPILDTLLHSARARGSKEA